MNSKWGAHDEFVLARQLAELKNEREPFFSSLLTLTSHEPFEIPTELYFDNTDDASRFRNAAHYTDKCLRDYFSKAEKESWFANTLFILVADHGHNLPLRRDYYDVKSHRIPLLFYGPALKDDLKGKALHGTGAQHDIAVTLLNQLELTSTEFKFSADLLDTCKNNFAYIDLDQSLGWVTDSGSFTYKSHSGTAERITGNPPDSLTLKQAAAYRQELYKVFLQLGKK